MSLKLVSEAAVEPIPVSEAKEYLRISDALEDQELEVLLKAARLKAEALTNRALASYTYDYMLDAAASVVELPRPPLVSVSGVYVTDYSDVETLVDSSLYFVDTTSEPGRVALKTGSYWPWYRAHSGFRVRFTCGYTAETLPTDLRVAVLQLTAFLYEHRGDVDVKLPDSIKTILASRKVYGSAMSYPSERTAYTGVWNCLR